MERFKFSNRAMKIWLLLGSLFFLLTNLALGCIETDEGITVWNDYKASVSASNTDPNVEVTQLLPGQTFYVWVYARALYIFDKNVVVDREYEILVRNNGRVVASQNSECERTSTGSYRCTTEWVPSERFRLVDILTLTLDEEISPDVEKIVVTGDTHYNYYELKPLLNFSAPLQKAQVEVRYNGVPINSNTRVELVTGLNTFSLHNVSTVPVNLSAINPRIRVNSAISLSQGFPEGSVTLAMGESSPFILNCGSEGEPNLIGILEILTNTSVRPLSFSLLCNPPKLPALGNQPLDAGGGIRISTAEAPQPTDSPPAATETPASSTGTPPP